MLRDELAALREVSASQGMMLESLREDLDAHRLAPDKVPARRLATLELAGELRIPFTTGILLGIGETRADRLVALHAIAEAHERHGHVQEVIVQNFLPKPGTGMAAWPAAPLGELVWSIAAARLVLPDDVHVQAPPNLVDDPIGILEAGADDLGGISPVTLDHVNPERAWPQLESLERVLDAHDYALTPRLTAYPAYVADPARWLDPAVRTAVLRLSDAAGLARTESWASGGTEPPPPPQPRRATGTVDARVREALEGVALRQELGHAELVALFSARGRDVDAVCDAADARRREIVGDTVTFVVNRNINYTNVCTFKCRFCAFSKGPLSLNLRGDPYVLGLDEVTRRVAEAAALGCTEVCLQGGIHPDFDGE
ncbi:MAG TPA: 7,8-didemethyl-8-hydroxy-5-deazariboflavin synthase CofG, partial [Acidimicrobiales bacterium]|nr:7,8-didemethyl-8-hydroxy-5-deazariboflavin synthase CofG [Acidimicrobiales bacterium]